MPESQNSDIPETKQSLKHRRLLDILAVAAILVVISAVFYKTLFLGQPISRSCLVAAKDVLFREFLAPATEIYFDESASQLFVPYKYLTSIYLQNHWLPLWNPYAGCGTPFLADIQAYALSPWTLLFSMMPSMRWLNLLIVGQVLFAAIATYALTRVLGVSILASVFAALCYSLCPRQLEWTELISASALPLVFVAFAMVSKQWSKSRLIAAALSCSLLLVSAHPEVSFIGITHATLFLFLLNIFNKSVTTSFVSASTKTALTITAIGVLTFAFSAPLLLPFVEFIKNSESYKFDSAHHIDSAFYWQWLVVNLFQPADRGDSPFLGAIVPILLAPAFLKTAHQKTAICLSLTAISAILLGCRPGLIGTVLFDTALNFNGTYYLPVILLMLCCCAAAGLDVTLTAITSKDRRIMMWLLIGGLFTLATPLLIDHTPSLKTAYQQATFRVRDLINNLCVYVGFALAITLAFRRKITVKHFTIITLALSLVSVLIPARWSLPGQGNFEYKPEVPLTFLQKNPGRALGISWDLLRPNNNVVYQISSLSMFNVLFPSRYRSFMRAAGGEVSTFNVLMVQPNLSHLLDLASVKYILSLAPITSENDPKPAEKTIQITPNKDSANANSIPIRILSAKLFFDKSRSQFSGSLLFDRTSSQSDQYAFNVIVTDEQGNQIWFGGINAIPSRNAEKQEIASTCEVPFTGIVPYHRPKDKKVVIGIKVFNSKTLKSNQGLTTICTLAADDTNETDSNNHFKLLDEFPPHHIRIYENQRAQPRAYMAHHAQIVGSGEEALKAISAKNFNCQNTVVIEGITPSQLFSSSANIPTEPATIRKESPNNLSIEVNNNSAGILVLTDVYYPGWKALLDGHEVPIYRANYLFRGVLVPAGKHTIEFSYFPNSFAIGLALNLTAILAALGIMVLRKRNT